MTILPANYSSKFIGFTDLTNSELVPNLNVGFFWDKEHSIAAIINIDPNSDEYYTVIASMELAPVHMDPLVWNRLGNIWNKKNALKITQYCEVPKAEPVEPSCIKTTSSVKPISSPKETLFTFFLEGLAKLDITTVISNNCPDQLLKAVSETTFEALSKKFKITNVNSLIVIEPKRTSFKLEKFVARSRSRRSSPAQPS